MRGAQDVERRSAEETLEAAKQRTVLAPIRTLDIEDNRLLRRREKAFSRRRVAVIDVWLLSRNGSCGAARQVRTRVVHVPLPQWITQRHAIDDVIPHQTSPNAPAKSSDFFTALDDRSATG